MSITDSLTGSDMLAMAITKDTMYADIVTGTLDALNQYDKPLSSTLAASPETLKADIVTGTLDALNQSSGKSSMKSDLSSSYDFQKTVLSSVYGSKGAVTSIKS